MISAAISGRAKPETRCVMSVGEPPEMQQSISLELKWHPLAHRNPWGWIQPDGRLLCKKGFKTAADAIKWLEECSSKKVKFSATA